MEIDLPVWSIRPNWKNGILERLEWLTGVLPSDTGEEQRISKRLTPRRSFEFTVNPTRRDRTYLDLALHRYGSEEWMMPLWHDQATLSATADEGDTRIDFDNTFREFVTGGLALIYRDTFTWEVVGIESQDDDGIDLTEALAADWWAKSSIFPLRKMMVSTDTTISALTSRVGQSQLLWSINEANPYPEIMPDDLLYLGAPILSIEPNRSQEIKLDHLRLFDEQDAQTGLRYRTDMVGRAFAVQSHNWMVRGREAQASFRSMLYWLRGRQRMLWLPSFNDDLILTQPVAIGAANAVIEKIGLGYLGGAIPGRGKFWTGSEVLTQMGMGAAPDDDTERVNFAAVTTHAYDPGAAWSFIEPARLNSDTVELHHHSDSDGMMECASTFQTFANSRTTPEPIYQPAPSAIKNNAVCGAPEADPNPCKPYESASLIVTTTPIDPCNLVHPMGRNMFVTPSAGNPPNGPGGKLVDNVGGAYPDDLGLHLEYENFEDGNPLLQGQLLWSREIIDSHSSVFKFYFTSTFAGASQFGGFDFCGSVGKASGSIRLTYTRQGEAAVHIDRVIQDFNWTYW